MLYSVCVVLEAILALKVRLCAYLRRCYVAPVLYRTAAGRCGTILDAVNDEASTNLAASRGVTVRASCRSQSGWETSAGLVGGFVIDKGRPRRHWSIAAPRRATL
jgi:hypothetical protein